MGIVIGDRPNLLGLGCFSRALGLKSSAAHSEIEKAFLRASCYSLDLEIREVHETGFCDELWEIEVTRGTDRHSVRARRGCRGEWKSRPDEIPQEILKFIQLDARHSGAMLSCRDWRSWTETRWANSTFKRRRSQADMFRFSMVFRGVEKGLGQTATELVVTSLDTHGAAGADHITIRFPIRSTDLIDLLEKVQELSDDGGSVIAA